MHMVYDIRNLKLLIPWGVVVALTIFALMELFGLVMPTNPKS